MAPKPRPVTTTALQSLLSRIGSASSGKKDVLRARLQKDLCQPRLFDARPDWKQRLAKNNDIKHRTLNIMSIDMGIKNFAYCRAAVSYPNGDMLRPKMEIQAWEKLNLIEEPSDVLPSQSPIADEEKTDPYSLKVLSETAHRFLLDTALHSPPDLFLIETQRWRSASSPAIQQWTVRVNTLEAMLWAILTALRSEDRNYAVHGVDPKRVGHYWLAQHAQLVAREHHEAMALLAFDSADEARAIGKKIPRSKAEKKAKIALLRKWLAEEPASTACTTPSSTPPVELHVAESATAAQRALCLPTQRKKKAKEVGDGGDGEEKALQPDMKKLDDITDCFMQAAAWVAWETNRLQLCDVWDGKKGDGATMPELGEDTLKQMVELIGD